MYLFLTRKKACFYDMNDKAYLKNCQSEIKEDFVPRKKQSALLSDVYRGLSDNDKSFLGRSRRVSECGSFLVFHISEDEHKLHLANFCKDRLCPMCNWRRSKKIFSQVSKVMNNASDQGYRFLFLTLTIRNCKYKDLQNTIDVLLNGWRFLYNKDKFFRKYIKGSFRALEITVNRQEKTFHPHLHCILAVDDTYFQNGYLETSEWASKWGKCCGLDYNPTCYIEAVKGQNTDDLEHNSSYWHAVKEVSKYVSKGSDYLNGDFSEILEKVSHLVTALSARRLCSFTGVLKKISAALKLDDLENGDLVHTDDELNGQLNYIVVRYRWNVGLSGYVSEHGEIID